MTTDIKITQMAVGTQESQWQLNDSTEPEFQHSVEFTPRHAIKQSVLPKWKVEYPSEDWSVEFKASKTTFFYKLLTRCEEAVEDGDISSLPTSVAQLKDNTK